MRATLIAFDQGFNDALAGRVSQAAIYNTTREHDEYVRGHKAGTLRREAYEQYQREMQARQAQQTETQQRLI